MASVSAALKVSGLALARSQRVDDIARFKQELGLADLNYVDISAEFELCRALKRWPLLAELEGENASMDVSLTSIHEVNT